MILATGTASAAPGLTITASDTKSGNATLISHELGVRLANTSCDCHVDASVTRLDVETTATGTTISAELDIAISNERGVVISVFEGSARASGTMRIAALRNEALTAAVDGMSTKIAGVLPRRLEPVKVVGHQRDRQLARHERRVAKRELGLDHRVR